MVPNQDKLQETEVVAELVSLPAKPLTEQILSPIVLQRMMSCGGGLLVLGFVGWLWSIGVFQNPIVVAFFIGTATLSVTGAGIGLVLNGRHELAGTGLTLLGVLAMPLNLWFYDAQGLVTISDGGHLWIPAAICCAIYAFVANVLRRPVFVYSFVAGVVLTGMLFLADQSVGRFWELMAPATFLVVVGWCCIGAERIFEPGEGDFSRDKFGRAFRIAGTFVLGSGFVLLLSGQLEGLLLNFGIGIGQAELTSNKANQLWAFGLIAFSATGFAVESFLVKSRRSGSAAATILAAWSIATLLAYFDLQPRLPHIVIAASSVVTLLNLISFRRYSGTSQATSAISWISLLIPFAIAAVAVAQFVAQCVVDRSGLFFAPAGWLVVTEIAVAASACLTTWMRLALDKESIDDAIVDGFSLLGPAIGVLAALSAPLALHSSAFDWVAMAGLVIPGALTVYSVASPRGTGKSLIKRAAGASVSTAVIGLAGLFFADVIQPTMGHFSWAWLLGATSLVYFSSAPDKPVSTRLVLGYATFIVAFGQLLAWTGLSADYSVTLAATLSGLALGTVTALWPRDTQTDATVGSNVAVTANWLVLVGTVAALLIAASRVIAQEVEIHLVAVLAIQLAGIAVVGLLAKQREWRLTFRAAAAVTTVAVIVCVNNLLSTHWLHRVELASLLAGVALLTIGHVGWYREGDTDDEGATVSLWLGSIAVALPISIGLLFYRSFNATAEWNWMIFHEIAGVTLALLLFGLGVACRIRSTTIAGSSLLTVYVLSLLALVQWPSQLQSVSVVMMIGGGIFFATAVLLSIYRDRLLGLPQEIREGRGVFRVLRWR